MASLARTSARHSPLALLAIALVSTTATGLWAQQINRHIIQGEIHVRQTGIPASYELVTPRNLVATNRYPLFIFLHGYGGTPQYVMNRDFALLTQQDFYILLPQAPDNAEGGFSWYRLGDYSQFMSDLERDEHILGQMIEELTASNNIDSSRVTLSGFSQGGRLAFCIGFRNPKLFSAIAPIGGFYMPELLDSRIDDAKHLRVIAFHGTQDNVNPFENVSAACSKFRQHGINTTLFSYPLAHTYTSEVLRRVLADVK
jgi:predicted esterase